jgi:ssDNA-binding replication factor A large subunit
MTRLRTLVPLLAILLVSVYSQADKKSQKISDVGRQMLVRNLNAESVFIKKTFPMGQKGLRIENGEVKPSDEEIQRMIADFGPAAKPGDRVRITNLYFKKNTIIFEINGGPVKKKKWWQRIEVGGSGGMTPVDPSDDNTNARGSFVVLACKD